MTRRAGRGPSKASGARQAERGGRWASVSVERKGRQGLGLMHAGAARRPRSFLGGMRGTPLCVPDDTQEPHKAGGQEEPCHGQPGQARSLLWEAGGPASGRLLAGLRGRSRVG